MNRLNREILTELETGGEAFLSNGIVNGRFPLRMCVVNLRTTSEDIEFLAKHIAETGARTFAGMQERRVAGSAAAE